MYGLCCWYLFDVLCFLGFVDVRAYSFLRLLGGVCCYVFWCLLIFLSFWWKFTRGVDWLHRLEEAEVLSVDSLVPIFKQSYKNLSQNGWKKAPKWSQMGQKWIKINPKIESWSWMGPRGPGPDPPCPPAARGQRFQVCVSVGRGCPQTFVHRPRARAHLGPNLDFYMPGKAPYTNRQND